MKKKKELFPSRSMDECLRDMIIYIGDDPDRKGLRETPARVIKSWGEIFQGYYQDPKKLFKVFDSEGYDEIIISKNIEFFSTCEHHMLPIAGYAHVGYLPNKHIIGLSKLARIVDCFSKRLQVQERLTVQITECLMKNLKPKGAACIVTATHGCQTCRGVKKREAVMTTSCMRGIFRSKPHVKEEFLKLALSSDRVK